MFNDPSKVIIKENIITESYGSNPGIKIENTSCVVALNEIKKNSKDGIYITTNNTLIEQHLMTDVKKNITGNSH